MTPQRLYLMHVATLIERQIPAVCYLIQTSEGQNILIDSGLPAREKLPEDVPAVELHENVIEQLAKLGLQPSDIDTVICSHFDLDHVGHHQEFPQAEFIVQQSHYDHALKSPRFARAKPNWDIPLARYRFVEGDIEFFPGIELLETSGHAQGHQSVLVTLPESGAVLLTIDAVPIEARFVPGRELGPMDEDLDALNASTQKLLDLVKQRNVSLVVFGHDGEQWQKLKKLPDYYG